MKNLFLLLLAVVLAGCAGMAPISREEINRVQFSAKPTKEESLTRIKNYLDQTLIDPDSLRLACSDVHKGWARHNYVADRPTFGYIAVCKVNAKNKLGGYTGAKEFVFLMNGNFFEAFKEIIPGKEYGVIE